MVVVTYLVMGMVDKHPIFERTTDEKQVLKTDIIETT